MSTLDQKTTGKPDPKTPVNFLELPNEIILPVAEKLGGTNELYSLVRTNRQLSRLLVPSLRRLACKTDKSSRAALFWAAASQDEILVQLLLEKSATLKACWYANNLWSFWARDSRRSTSNTVTFILNQGANLVICEPGAPYSSIGGGLNWASATEVNHQALFMFLMQKSINGRIVLSLAGLAGFSFVNYLCFEIFGISLFCLIFSILYLVLKASPTIFDFLYEMSCLHD